ncbi:hypothetical protein METBISCDRAFT_24775 [Metschnikowia bicuspidata]|uniref:Uncharacterized protein n=1 Tax=Metschnikowia bicuspidata TaxID=27322 RepID=A0A4P9Z975_9ASCO|nr:hypothetical protein METBISCDRAFT_24775 [Metschnikowia bicuspidata]
MTFTGSMSSPLARHTAACEDTPTAQTRQLKRTWYSDRGKRIQNIGYESRLNAAVAPSDYIKWLPQDAAAPDKMRQLLIWCFQGQLDRESTEEDPQKKEIAGVAKLIETEILSGLVNGKVSVDWTRTTNDEDLDDTLLTNKRIVKANTVNRRNARDIELFTEKLARLRDEEASWSRAYKVAVRPLETLTTDGNSVTDSAFLAYLQKRADGADLRHDVVERGIEKASNSALACAHKSIKEDLDANTDKIFHLLHRLKQGVVLATKLEQEKFSNKMSHLVRSFASYKASTRGGREYTARDLLRGISRIDVATGKAVK